MIIVIDLETTGLSPFEDCCVWDFAAVAVRDGEIVSEYQSRVRPALECFQEAQREVPKRISDLSDADLLALLDAPTLDAVRAGFLVWLARLYASETLPCEVRMTAFNASFDWSFLRESPWQLFQWMEACGLLLRNAPCVMKHAAGRLGYAGGRVSLGNACAAFGVPQEDGAHHALADARATARLAIHFGLETGR